MTKEAERRKVNQLNPWRRALLEKLKVHSVNQEIPSLYGTRKFVTVFTRVLSHINSVHTLKPYFPNMYFNIIISKPMSSGWNFSFRRRNQNFVRTCILPLRAAYLTCLTLLDLITLIIPSE